MHTKTSRAGRVAGITLGLGVVLASVAAPGPARATTSGPPSVMTTMLRGGGTISGPYPYVSPPFTEPAGEVCSFALTLTPTTNRTFFYRYDDPTGFDAAEYYYGPLVVTARNDATGASESLNLSASGLYRYGHDGSTVIDAVGPYGFGLHADDRAPGHPGPFYAVPSGVSHARISATGQRTIAYATGGVRDICAELG